MIYSRSPAIWGEDFDILNPAKVTTFVKIPYPQVLRLAKGKNAVFGVLMELIWLQFKSGKNPVRYAGSRLDRHVRIRGLKRLKQENWILVVQERGKAPLVTLRWIKLTRAETLHDPCGNVTKPVRKRYPRSIYLKNGSILLSY
jgi:hypothetical protein